MAVITVTPIALAINVATPDLVGADADDVAVDVVATDTFRIDCRGVGGGKATEGRIIIVLETQTAGAATVTFNAGDYPAAMLKFKGSLAIELAASDLKVVVLEAGRFLQDDGYITGSIATTACYMTAYYMPAGY